MSHFDMKKQNYAYLLNYLFPDNDYVGDLTTEIIAILDGMVNKINEKNFVRVRWGMGELEPHLLRRMEEVFAVKKITIHYRLSKGYMRLRTPEIRKELHEHMREIGCNLNWKDVW